MSLSVKKFLCRAQLSWWTEDVFGQGKIYLTVFHRRCVVTTFLCLWSLVNTTFDVSWRYIRADLGITFSASAALPIDAPYAVDTLSIVNLCLCFSFGVYIAWWRVHIYVYGCI